MFMKGLVFGLLAAGINFAIIFLGLRLLMGRTSAVARIGLGVAYAIRYAIFAGLVFLFLKIGLGSVWGLLTGVTAGIAGSIVWQMVQLSRARAAAPKPVR
jgi:hypothetical protein